MIQRGQIVLVTAVTGALVLTASGTGAGAATAPETTGVTAAGGSGFQSMALNALAGGLQVSGDGLAGQPPGSAAAAVPLASSQLSRSVSHSLASVAWPGSLAGNAGSLLLLLGPNPCVPGDDPVAHQPIPVAGGTCDTAAPVPQPVLDNYHNLNSPVRAEAGYPSAPHAHQGADGADMTADAAPDSSSAVALVGGGATSNGLGFGTVTSNTILRAAGPTAAMSKAWSSAQNVSVATVLTIDSVTSSAASSTTGTAGTASGTTTVSGMKVAGVPVTVDGHGLHAGGTGPNSDAATAAAQAALAAAGIRVYLTAPTKHTDRGSASFHAGSLVIDWDVDQAGPKNDVVIVMGGADASAAATLAYQSSFGGLPGAVPPFPTAGSPGPGSTLPGSGLPNTSSATTGGRAIPAAGPAVAATLAAVTAKFGLPLAGGWVLLILLGAALIAFGGGRLPDRLLTKGTSRQCVEGVTRRVE